MRGPINIAGIWLWLTMDSYINEKQGIWLWYNYFDADDGVFDYDGQGDIAHYCSP